MHKVIFCHYVAVPTSGDTAEPIVFIRLELNCKTVIHEPENVASADIFD